MNIGNAGEALVYLTECTLATVAHMSTLKSRAKYEYGRQIAIAQKGIDWITEFHITPNTRSPRVVKILSYEGKKVSLWLKEQFGIDFTGKIYPPIATITNSEEALIYLTDCTLATIEGMATIKSKSKSEFKRQITIAQQAIDLMIGLNMNIGKIKSRRGPLGIRVDEILFSESKKVEDWVRAHWQNALS